MLPICANRKDTGVMKFDDIVEDVHSFLAADCHAIVVDGDTLYSTYDPPTTARERVAQAMLRSWAIDNTRELLRSTTVLEIYMFGEHPWMVRVDSGKVMTRWTSPAFDAAYTL